MHHVCALVGEIVIGAAAFAALYFFFLYCRLGGPSAPPYRMDPVQAATGLQPPEVPGGFEPHLKRYQDLAQLVLTLATASVAFLVNFLTGIHVDEKRNIYSLKLEAACPYVVALLGLSAVFAIFFILRYNTTYETYCHTPLRNTYTSKAYATNLALGYSTLCWFLIAYIVLACWLFA
jgi:hypothetical protein